MSVPYFLLFSFLILLVPGFARAQAANIFYCAFGVVKATPALCDGVIRRSAGGQTRRRTTPQSRP
jgi:hypothetical protein